MTNPRHAILIGINHYNSAKFPELEFCVKDAEALGEVLRKEENYQTQLLTSTSESNPPTAQNIETALKNVSQASSTLLVYFSGHGHRDKEQDDKPILVTCDGSTLPLADVIALMNKSPASQKILLLDACFQGLETKAIASSIAQLFQKSASMREENTNSQRAKPKRTSAFYSGYALFHDSEGFAMLAASTASQMAREAVALGHGYFTYHLLQGLESKALRDNKPFITVVDLALYTARQLRNMSWGEDFQEPTSLLAMKGDLILLKTASFTPDSRPQIVPRRMAFRYNVRFVSRKKQLETLKETFRNNNQREIIVVTGIGGVGKTQIAGQFVYEHERDFPGGVFWLNFANGEQVLSEIADCGGKLYMNLKGFDPEKPKENAILVKAEWNKEGGPRRLLIFDNCEDPALLRDHLPNSNSNCAVLVTSRRSEKDWPKHNLGSDEKPFFLSDSQILALDVLKDDSLSFFEKFRKFNTEEKGILSDIAKTLGHLPLALHLAGSVLGSPGMKREGIKSVRKYLADLERNPFVADSEYLKQVADLAKAGEDRGVGGETDTPTGHDHVCLSFELTYIQLKPGSTKKEEEYDDLALKLLFRAAFFKPAEPIPADLLKKTASNDQTKSQDTEWGNKLLRALERLVNLGLLEWAGREDIAGYAMHTLTSAFVRARAIAVERKAEKEDDPSEKAKDEQQAKDLQKELDSAQEDVERVVYERVKSLSNDVDILGIMKILSHLLTITDAAMRNSRKWSFGLAALTADHLYLFGEYQNAEIYFRYADNFCDQELKKEPSKDPLIAELLDIVAYTLRWNKDNFAKSYSYQKRAVAICPNNCEYSRCIADTLRFLGEHRKALKRIKRVLRKVDRKWATQDFELNWSDDHWGSYNTLYLILNEMGEATEELRIAERLQKSAFEENLNGRKLSTYSCLVVALINMGRYEEAAENLQKVEQLGEELYGEDAQNIDTAITHRYWGRLLRFQGRYQEAQERLQQALAIEDKLAQEGDKSDSSLGIAFVLNEFALLLKDEGLDLPLAHHHAQRALEIRQERLRENHPRTAQSHQTLGEVLLAQGDLVAARENLTKALTIRQAKFGDANSLTAESRYTLALLTAAEGNSQEAALLMRQALAIRETKLGPAHPLTQASRQQLADLEQKLSQA